TNPLGLRRHKLISNAGSNRLGRSGPLRPHRVVKSRYVPLSGTGGGVFIYRALGHFFWRLLRALGDWYVPRLGTPCSVERHGILFLIGAPKSRERAFSTLIKSR